MREIYVADAIREGLAAALAEDERVMVIGEDVELSTIGTTKGLLERFGATRVRNSPISEAAVLGACTGAAATGMRPVFDIMFSSFFYVCLDALANQAARLRYMSGGQIEVPLTVLAPTGPAGSAAAQHSENPHAMMAGIGGIKVVFPSSAEDFKGLLVASIREPNPVVFFADLLLMGNKGDVPEGTYSIPLGVADVKRPGDDVTVVALGMGVQQALKAAEELSGSGVSVEVVDVRSVVPLDWATISTSVSKTGRVVVVDPGRMTCGVGAELIAGINERNFGDLKAAPARVTWPDTPIPYSPPLEEAVTISVKEVRDAISTVAGR